MKLTILAEGQIPCEVTFNDISSEQWRIYDFPNGCSVRIEEPLWLYVSKSGGHRLVDKAGMSHYIPKGWLHLYWKVYEGQPFFVR